MIIALNHKSNMEKDDFIKYIEELKEIKIKDNKIILCPSYLNIPTYPNIRLIKDHVQYG